MKARNFQILVPRVPVIFEPDNKGNIRELEEQNNMTEGSLPKARWIKPVYRRTLGQHSAHLALSVSTPEDANTLIRDGIYICGVKTYPRKLKTEPKQCMKCRKWGHFAADCLEDKDACGNCGENHHTKECPDSSRRYCISCKLGPRMPGIHKKGGTDCYVFLTYYCAHNGLSLGPSSLLRHTLPSRTDYDSYTSF
jgi:hypothetical protein